MVLKEKLEEARLQSAKRRRLLWIGLFATLCLGGLGLLGLSLLDFSAKDNAPIVVAEKESVPETDMAEYRDDFMERLQQYENELEPRLQDTDLEQWNPDAFFQIKELKDQTLLHFSSSDYPEALETLQLLKERSEEILVQSEQIYAENLNAAASSLAEDLYEKAKFHIDKALMVAPNSNEALELQMKIEKLPHILPLLNEAKVARAEKDLQKEFEFLQKVLRITPERKEAAERVSVLSGLIKEEQFESHIAAGFAAVENKQEKEARHFYQLAKKVDSAREELSLLLGQILALEKSLRVQRAVKQAEQAIRRDDWLQARKNFAIATKDAPENKTVVEGLRRADLILDLQARLSRFTKNPYRLAHVDVRADAEKALTQAETASNYSFAIKRQAEELRELIGKLNRSIPVTIISDNETYVIVRSVGKVGAVSEKIIQLKPGSYTFEGTRRGFKSKLVQRLIPYNQDNFSVRIICDEPI
jgi:tetratricopeptide (TPR) repeat protein